MNKCFTWAWLGLAIIALSITGCWEEGRTLTFERFEIDYATSVTRVDAAKLGEYLLENGYFDDSKLERMRLWKSGKKYYIDWVAGKDFQFYDGKISDLLRLQDSLSLRVFKNRPVQIELADRNFTPRWPVEEKPGEIVRSGPHHLFFKDPVTRGQADSLVEFLKANSNLLDEEDDGYVMLMERAGDKYIFKLAVERNALFQPLIETCRDLQTQLTRQLFPNQLVDLELCDPLFTPMEQIVDQPYSKSWSLGPYEIDYSSEVSLHEVAKLRDYLDEHDLLLHTSINIGLSRRFGAYQIAYQTHKGVNDPDEAAFAQELLEALSNEVFQGAKVEIQLHDPNADEYRIFRPEKPETSEESK